MRLIASNNSLPRQRDRGSDLTSVRAVRTRGSSRRPCLELLEAISLLCEDRSLDALSAIHDVLVTMQDYGQRG